MEDKKKSLADFISPESQEMVRNNLFMALRRSKMGLVKAAEDMNISFSTLHKFLSDNKDVSFETLLKMDHFIMKYEE